MAIIVDAVDADGKVKVFTAGSAITIDTVLEKDDATYNLTGKTVVATVRSESRPRTVIHANLEDISVTPGAGTTAAASGGVGGSIAAADSARLGPTGDFSPDKVEFYVVQFKVTTDSFKASQLLRFGVRQDID